MTELSQLLLRQQQSQQQEERWMMEQLTEEDDIVAKSVVTMFSIIMSNLLLFFLIFGLSATVQVKTLRHQLTNKFAIFTGVAMQFMIMPVLGFVAVFLLRGSGFTQAMGVSLLVVTASPGGSYSNWWCSIFNAELALSVAMTSVSSVLSIALLPANLFLYTWLAYTVAQRANDNMNYKSVLQSIDFEAVFVSLGVVMGAIVLGLAAGYKYDNPTFHKRANGFGSFCGISLILFSIFLSTGTGEAETNIFSLPWSFYIGVAFPCLLGMTLANFLSRTFRLSPPECVAISIECCYQNTAIATSVAVTMFQDPNERAEAISVPLFYGVVEALLIGSYCVWAWKMGWTKAPASEKFCVVVTKTYEVDEPGQGTSLSQQQEEQEEDSEASKGCWKNMFKPKSGHESVKHELPLNTTNKAFDRARFNSVDETLATTAISPPNTPDVPQTSTAYDRKIGSNAATRAGLESLSAPSMIEVIREDTEGTVDCQRLTIPSTNSLFYGTNDQSTVQSNDLETLQERQTEDGGFETILEKEEPATLS